MPAAFGSILIALDGGQGGMDAAALGAQLIATDSRVALAHVRAGVGGASDTTSAAAVAAMRRYGAALAGKAPELLTVRAGSVIAGLRQLVDARGVELLVIGAHHHRHLNLASHDHTRDVLRQVPCAIAVAPWGYAGRPRAEIGSVGVGYVDDRGGRVVLDVARGLAWQLGVEVQATTIVAPSHWPDSESGAGWRALAAARRMAEIPGIHRTVVEGDPYHALLELSRAVDVLVVGTHHRGAVRRLLPRDVAEGLSHAAGCPLVIVPHDR